MKKLFWLSDSPFFNTGYSTISRNVLNGLADEYECNYMGNGFQGGPILPGKYMEGLEFKFKTYGHGRFPYCQELIMPRLQQHKSEFFGILLDTFMCYPWLMNQNFTPAKSFFYFPSDGGGGLPQNCNAVLKHMHAAVAMSKFAQKQVKDYHGLDAHYIPHAVDTRVYFPMSKFEREMLRANHSVVGVNGGRVQGALSGKFVIGTVARNQGRKMLDRTVKTIAAFAKFAQDKPNAFLYMHTDPDDNAAVSDIKFLIKRFGVENRVGFSEFNFFEGWDYRDMVKIYNLMDVFMLSTSGEGFGIPIIEAMACGVPCAVTDYTTTPELLIEGGRAGIPIALAGTEQISYSDYLLEKGNSHQEIDFMFMNGTLTGNWNVERAIMSVPDAVKVMNTLYEDPALRAQLGETGRQKVLKQYSWDVVIPMWKDFLRRLDAGQRSWNP